jgi:DNA-binding MarR family transcriptional regulator
LVRAERAADLDPGSFESTAAISSSRGLLLERSPNLILQPTTYPDDLNCQVISAKSDDAERNSQATDGERTQGPRWLSGAEEAAWRAIAKVVVTLPWALECQLQQDAGLSFLEYHVLARLSEDPEHTLRMSELAKLTDASLSRLSHLMKRLELRDLVRRGADPADCRFTNATMTRVGYKLLVASAPGHLARVRSLVIDALSPAELGQLHEMTERLLARIEESN